MKTNIIFMGTPEIAATVLNHLLEAGANVSLVVSQPDRKIGRKQILHPTPVKTLAQEHGIEVFQPENIKKEYQRIVDEQADLIVTCAYGQIVPEAVLNAAKQGCVNLHGSILPEYRGAAPIQRAIMDGKTETGMTLMRMEKGMDTGAMMDVAKIAIETEDTSDSLFEKMGHLAGELIVKNLDCLLKGEAQFEDQDESLATYAPMISREEERIDFSKPDQAIYNQIRGLSRTPGAYGVVKGKKLKVLNARYVPGSTPGLGLLRIENNKKMILGLHDGLLELIDVQLEGRPQMSGKAFANGAGRSLDGQQMELEG